MKKNKKLIIGVIAIVLVAVIGIGGYFLIQKINENKSVGTEWGDTYYKFLENEIKEEYILNDLIDCDIQFVPQENENPVMIVKYIEEHEDRRYDIFYIDKDKKVQRAFSSLDFDDKLNLELLYNRKEEKYKWYIVSKSDNQNDYEDLLKILELSELQNKLGGYEKAKDNDEYKKLDKEKTMTFVKDHMPPKEILEDTPISRFEETFIEIENAPEIKKIDVGTLENLKETKKIIIKAVSEYKNMEKTLTDEVKESVAKSIEKIDNRKATIEKKAEEDKKRKEEEAQKGLKVGNNTLKYGTYIGYVGNSATGDNFVLKQNGQCEYGGQSCTYTVGTCNMSQDVTVDMQPCLQIKYSKYDHKLFPKSNSEFHDGDMESFKYQG